MTTYRHIARPWMGPRQALPLLLWGLLCAHPVEATQQFRGVAWTFKIYGGTGGEHDDPGSALVARNAAVDETYNRCMGSSAVEECHSGCYKLNHYGLEAAPGRAIVNGISTFQTTLQAISTTFAPACGPRQAETLVRDVTGTGSIAVAGTFFCPPATGWSATTSNLKYIDLRGMQTATYDAHCVRTVPANAQCKGQDPPAPPLVGNPVDPVGNAKVETALDYASAHRLLQVVRSYTSAGGGLWTWGDVGSALADFTGRGLAQPSSLVVGIMQIPPGYYAQGQVPPAVLTARSFPLLKTQPDTGQKEVLLDIPNGRSQRFVEGPAGTFTSTTLPKYTLTVGTSPLGAVQWLLKTGDDYLVFNEDGYLAKRAASTGEVVSYVRSSDQVTATAYPSGRRLVYAKSAAAAAAFDSVTLPDGSQLRYQVDQFARINSVIHADTHARTYLYNEAAYTGTSTAMPAWLTGIVDENGVRYATFTYDGTYPLSTEHAGGVGKYTFATYIGATSITTPLSSGSRVQWDIGPDGERRLTSMSQPAGSGCAASAQSLAYDANGYTASRNDFNGWRTCFLRDPARGLATSQVDGLAAGTACASVTPANAVLPTGSRKTTTLWHPDWQRVTRQAAPGRITTNVYNGQPDPFNGNSIASCAPGPALLPDGKPIAVLCKQVEQATTDKNGALGFAAALESGVAKRETRWTYNEFGQVLTEDGPRTDVTDVTTYAYYSDTTADHAPGDLQQITDAAGQVTRYTKYDSHGQLLESVRPNGTQVTQAYDLRQRLISTRIGDRTTTMEYDAAGQLKKLTQPDGSWIGYDYDQAHRQVAVYDHQGNRIDYTLDAAGNRIAEQTQDPNGQLQRQLARSIDALGRVQQTTGRE